MMNSEKLAREVAITICKLQGWRLGDNEQGWTKEEREAYCSAIRLQMIYMKLYTHLARWNFDADFIATEIFEQSIHDWDPSSRTYNVGSSIAGRNYR